MAVFFSSPLLTPRAAPQPASVFAAPRVNRRQSIRLAATIARAAATAGEILFFFWTISALAFSFLVAAGFFA